MGTLLDRSTWVAILGLTGTLATNVVDDCHHKGGWDLDNGVSRASMKKKQQWRSI